MTKITKLELLEDEQGEFVLCSATVRVTFDDESTALVQTCDLDIRNRNCQTLCEEDRSDEEIEMIQDSAMHFLAEYITKNTEYEDIYLQGKSGYNSYFVAYDKILDKHYLCYRDEINNISGVHETIESFDTEEELYEYIENEEYLEDECGK